MGQTNDGGVAANVRAQLARHMISQRTIATVLGLTKTAMSRRMRGETEFRANELQAIATHLGVDVASFYTSEVA